MDSVTIAVIVCIIIDIPLFIFIGKLMFGSWCEFWEAVTFWLTPDIFSMFNGEYWHDVLAELKLGVFLALCGGCIIGEILLITKWLISPTLT